MCQKGSCGGRCKRQGRRRPEACLRYDFTPLTMTLSVSPTARTSPTAEAIMIETPETPVRLVLTGPGQPDRPESLAA